MFFIRSTVNSNYPVSKHPEFSYNRQQFLRILLIFYKGNYPRIGSVTGRLNAGMGN
jgi:hypothetical protein